jgi:hypothetical protein
VSTIGIDTASVDENGNPYWERAAMPGHCRFVGLRAAEGMTPDPSYPTYRRQLDALAIPNFPYLRLVPGVTLTPPDQVMFAIKTVIGVLNQTYFPLALDIEGDRRGLTAAQWRDWVVQAAIVARDIMGVYPMLYTSRTYWADPDGMNGLPAPELVHCLGWWKFWPYPVDADAVYDPATVDQLHPPPVPTPWGGQWGIQQYQGDAVNYPGFRSTVDMNRLHIVREGDTGDTVKWIQRRLKNLVIDGIFGPKTAEAVRGFQTLKRIAADGIVGLDTMQRLAWVRL